MIDTIRPVCPCPIYSKQGFIFTHTQPSCPSKKCQELQYRQAELQRRYYAIAAMLVQR